MVKLLKNQFEGSNYLTCKISDIKSMLHS